MRDAVLAHHEAHPDRLLTIVGPTASGKTALAIDVAARIGGEIVSADSVQVYRGFDIGAGKPSPEERSRAPHHLIDVVDPLDAMDAARWVKLADDAIADIRARGRVPIVCGGTYLWTRALVWGLAEMPSADEAIRERHRAIVENEGRNALHDRLRAVDAASAERLHPNDVVRVSRALEVHELTGRTMSAEQAAHAFGTVRYDAALFAIEMTPEELTRRIAARVDAMLANGFVEEVDGLIRRGFAGARAMSSVGYAEVRAHLRGELPRTDLAPSIVRATRVFARRQRTWLRRAPVKWLTP